MLKWSKLTEYEIRKVVQCFSLDLTATQTAALLRLNRKTVNALYQRFRLLITWQRLNQRREFRGVVQVDESYFGPSRVRGRALPSPRRAMSEAFRVLRGRERFAFTVWPSSDQALQQLLIEAINCSGVPGSSLPAPPQGDIKDIDTCKRLLLESGFSADHSSFRKLQARVAVSSAASLIEMLAKGTARASALIRLQPDEAMPAVVAALEAAMAQYRSETSELFEIPAVAILAVGTRT